MGLVVGGVIQTPPMGLVEGLIGADPPNGIWASVSVALTPLLDLGM